MSTKAERERIVLALAGVAIPKVGDLGVVAHAGNPTTVVLLRVVRVSASGNTLWAWLRGRRTKRLHARGWERKTDYRFGRAAGTDPVRWNSPKGAMYLLGTDR